MQERFEIIAKELASIGMECRNDSTLLKRFVDDTLRPRTEPKQLALEISTIHKIHTHTLYPELIEDIMRQVATTIREQYSLPWGDTWIIVRTYVPSMLKLYCTVAFPFER